MPAKAGWSGEAAAIFWQLLHDAPALTSIIDAELRYGPTDREATLPGAWLSAKSNINHRQQFLIFHAQSSLLIVDKHRAVASRLIQVMA